MDNLKHLNRDYYSLRNSGSGLVGDAIISDFVSNSELTKDSNESYENKLDAIINLLQENNINIDIVDSNNFTQSQYDNYVKSRENGATPESSMIHLK